MNKNDVAPNDRYEPSAKGHFPALSFDTFESCDNEQSGHDEKTNLFQKQTVSHYQDHIRAQLEPAQLLLTLRRNNFFFLFKMTKRTSNNDCNTRSDDYNSRKKREEAGPRT